MIYSGTSGLVIPMKKELFPHEFRNKSRLTYYASLFNSIEINSSFYKMPLASTVKKWSESVPGNFRFTFKYPKTITHSKDLIFNPGDIEKFMQIIAASGDKKGCLLVQFPPSIKVEKLNIIKKLLMLIQREDSDNLWDIAFEFRDKSWYCKDLYELLYSNNTSLVIHDIIASATPITNHTADHVYIRFHGPDETYKGSYSNYFLQAYAQKVNEWKAQGKRVYIYFNNTIGNAYKNLITLNSMLTL
jgi:uncharacterized protein YecE (DUF72 family)